MCQCFNMLILLYSLLFTSASSSFLDLDTRIAGGEDAEYIPWIAALSYGVVTKFQCAGSIITNKHILTAAHCISAAYKNGSLVSSYMATVGMNTIRVNGTGKNYNIIRNYTHPNYKMSVVKNDLGILVTNTSIVFSLWVKQITLNFNTIGDGIYVIVYGWGSATASGYLSRELQKLEMITVNATYCFEETRRVGKELGFIPPYIDIQKELCAYKAEGYGTCKGDSGSPLVCAKNSEQVGLTSWGIPCAMGAPDIFTRISNYQDFIFSVLDETGDREQLKYTNNSCTINDIDD